MPIVKKLTAGTTNRGNGGKMKIEQQSTSSLRNNMSTDLLIDPDDDSYGSTYTSIKAAAKSTNVGTLDNDVDPTKGYLDEADEELDNNNAPQKLKADAADADWDPAPEGDDDSDDSEYADDEDEGDDAIAIDETHDDVEELVTSEDMSILDVDETGDDEVEDVAFATAGTRLLVIKANRIIASMTDKTAKASGRADVYLSDQFQTVASSELAKRGLRAGLKSMGFVLAKVNVTKASVVNARVQLQVTKTTAAVRKVQASKEAAFEQSLAIAAVGMNRRYFKEENELKTHLEASLQNLGLKGAGKMLQRAFSQFGPAYAKTVIDLAHKISAMPEESRAGYVAALDLTTEELDEEGEDMLPIGAEEVDEEDDEFADDTVAKTLATAGIKNKGMIKALVTSGAYSVKASAILSGESPFML